MYGFTTLWIYTILKHIECRHSLVTVSLPYGFTLFSNLSLRNAPAGRVSLPYGFTLFSNYEVNEMEIHDVSLPYGFTLFSNANNYVDKVGEFHYLMDLHYSQT